MEQCGNSVALDSLCILSPSGIGLGAHFSLLLLRNFDPNVRASQLRSLKIDWYWISNTDGNRGID